MLSRVANSIYWLARYIERAENVARSIDVNLQLQLDLPGEVRPWEPVIQIAGNADDFFKKYAHASFENALTFLTFDKENPSSIISCVAAARENARCVRERISSELWIAINQFYLKLSDAEMPKQVLAAPHAFYSSVKEFSQLTAGIIQGTMSHDVAWNFTHLGTLLERADQTSRILDVKYYILLPDVSMVGMALDTVQWNAVLKSVGAYEMFHRRNSDVTPHNVAEFLLLSEDFPRSLRYCLEKAEQCLKNIAVPVKSNAQSIRLLGKLRSDISFTTIEEIIEHGLHEQIEKVQIRLNELGNQIWKDFFC
ncbi:MAG: alpha-E domain-containing protein [Fibrobacter sp.]|uniref:alpha-E domain-containing protein n=1 Tax=Fibrobacter sp. TaxID=35828 RepID=UPI0025B9BB69|nr:alpha-E domain-containing protein [Fibrobacter sp.]MBQ7080221.1 alpha-E domain-containing protein [Fibrobacter sp.]